MELKPGLMVQNMMDIIRKVKNMEKVFFFKFLGTYYWNDGSKFSGDWLDNKISGFVN